jgi:anti-anti-sigma factor
MAYTLEHDPIDSGHLIVITGELDIAATPELSTVLLMTASSPGTLVVLDLAGVSFIDSTALGTLLNAGGEIESAGKRLRIVCAEGPVRRLLEMTNLTNRFQLCPSRDVALPA